MDILGYIGKRAVEVVSNIDPVEVGRTVANIAGQVVDSINFEIENYGDYVNRNARIRAHLHRQLVEEPELVDANGSNHQVPEQSTLEFKGS